MNISHFVDASRCCHFLQCKVPTAGRKQTYRHPTILFTSFIKGLTKINHKLVDDKYKTQVLATHPKKELTSTPLVLSSSGTDSVAFVSGMSAEAFMVVKKA